MADVTSYTFGPESGVLVDATERNITLTAAQQTYPEIRLRNEGSARIHVSWTTGVTVHGTLTTTASTGKSWSIPGGGSEIIPLTGSTIYAKCDTGKSADLVVTPQIPGRVY